MAWLSAVTLSGGVLLSASAQESTGDSTGGAFSDQAQAAGVFFLGGSYMAASADFDRDGDQDLAYSRHFTVALLRNDGDGRFTDLTETLNLPEGDFHGLNWLDVNSDGWLDLLIVQGGERGVGVGNGNLLYVSKAGQSFQRVAPSPVVLDPSGRGRNIYQWDVNRDAIDDLVITNAQSDQSRWVVADGGTDYQRDVAESLGYSALVAGGFWAGRLSLDPASPDHQQQYVLAYGNRAEPPNLYSVREDGRLLRETPFRGLPTQLPYGVADVVVADFDNDADLDFYYVADVDEFDEVRERENLIEFQFRLRESNGRKRAIRFAASGRLRINLRGGDALGEHGIRLGDGDHALTKRAAINVDDERLLGEPDLDEERDAGAFLWSPEPGVLELIALGDLKAMYFLGGSMNAKHGEVRLLAVEGMPNTVPPPCNLLYLFDGKRFVERGEAYGVRDCGPGRDGEALDVNNDGWMDIFVANGHGAFGAADNVLLLNGGENEFQAHTDVEIRGPETGRSGTALALDYDGDGDQDLFVAHGAGAPPIKNAGTTQLLRNDSSVGRWLKIELQPHTPSRSVMGAIITVTTSQRTYHRQLSPGFSAGVEHFGLGEAQSATVTVRWPSGAGSSLSTDTNQRVTILEPEPAASQDGI